MTKQPVDYTTIREDFDTYRCENGQILRHKPILTGIYESDDDPALVQIDDISDSITPDSVDSSYLKKLDYSPETKSRSYNLKFQALTTTINIYETKSYLLTLYSDMQNIFLTDQRDKNGDPVLHPMSKAVINIIDKKTFQETTPFSMVG